MNESMVKNIIMNTLIEAGNAEYGTILVDEIYDKLLNNSVLRSN